MKRVLFLDTVNGWAAQNPRATLVQVDEFDAELLSHLESMPGVYNRVSGTILTRLLRAYGRNSEIVKLGNQGDFLTEDYDCTYKLRSGNY